MMDEDEVIGEVESVLHQISFAKPRIFEGDPVEWPHADFNAVTLSLDGGVKADLKWDNERCEAERAVERGFSLMWELELGLFQGLSQPLSNQGQFHSLSLSVEHFRDTLGKDFKESTLGVSLYRGNADFRMGFPWDLSLEQSFKEWLRERGEREEASMSMTRENPHALFFCREVALDYLSLLSSRLPDSLPAYLFLDASSFKGSFTKEINYLNPEAFERFNLALRGHSLPFEAIGWGKSTPYGYSGRSATPLNELSTATVGLCVPSKEFCSSNHDLGLEEALVFLQTSGLSYRIIAESQLTGKWDGLDYLLYSPHGLSSQGKRKLLGFCAAGGTVVSTSQTMGLPLELAFSDWKELLLDHRPFIFSKS